MILGISESWHYKPLLPSFCLPSWEVVTGLKKMLANVLHILSLTKFVMNSDTRLKVFQHSPMGQSNSSMIKYSLSVSWTIVFLSEDCFLFRSSLLICCSNPDYNQLKCLVLFYIDHYIVTAFLLSFSIPCFSKLKNPFYYIMLKVFNT